MSGTKKTSVGRSENDIELGRLRLYVFMIVFGWTLTILFFSILGRMQLVKTSIDRASNTALNTFQKDLIYRKWAAAHGGVYVPVTPTTPPNPYLTMVKNRDIDTPAGRLTLMNPSYMTRQVFEMQLPSGIMSKGHLTSLRPIRPENKADEWETKALESFEKGETERIEIEQIDGKRYLRFMRPFIVESSCLKCHAQQGYKIGEIRGGISVSIPMDFTESIVKRDTIYLVVRYTGVWLIGVAGIVFGWWRLRRHMIHHHKLEAEVRRSEELYDLSQKAANIGSWDWDIIADRLRWSPQVSSIIGIEQSEFAGGRDEFLGIVLKEDRDAANAKFQSVFKSGTNYDVEYRIVRPDSEIRWLSVSGKLFRDVTGKPYRMIGIVQDITERKAVENELAKVRNHEISIGMEIQNQLLLGRPPKNLKGAHVTAISIPAQKIGGDFYDFIEYDDRHFDIILGDVMGKGISAALCGAATKMQFLHAINDLLCSSHMDSLPTIRDVVMFAHREMAEKLITIESFITACIARIDLETMQMSMIDCGHTATIHYRNSTGKCELLKTENCPIGFNINENYIQQIIPFAAGDLFFFYSDGVIEAKTRDGEYYGLERLVQFIESHGQLGADELLHAVEAELKAFVGEEAFHDDITYIIVKF